MSFVGTVVRARVEGALGSLGGVGGREREGRELATRRPATGGELRPRCAPIVRLWALLLALLAGLAIVGAPAATAAAPALALQDGTPRQVLYGDVVPVSLTASLPTGSAKGYNLAYRVVLPVGATYVAGSAGARDGDPQQIVDQLTGRTTLIWPNVDDLVADSSHALDFRVRYRTTDQAPATHYDVGDVLAIESEAFISENARDEADFDALGVAVGPRPGSFSSRAAAVRTVELSALQIQKSEPHPEGEIPRGLHDHQTTYTLKVRNNHVNPTSGITVEDYVPAGLEFLGCAGQVDNTTATTTNPGSAEEYPGSGPIVVTKPTAAEGCIAPDHVETVRLDPDGDGPLELGVYTYVRWNLAADLLKDGELTLRYAAAIPLRENTLDWTGATPGVDGGQTANLDNNAGPETYDEQPLINGARASGTYRAPGKPGRAATDWDVLERTAEDIAIQKSNDRGSIEQGDLTTWTIDLQVSEYRSLADVEIVDTVPNGLCPLGAANHETVGVGRTSANDECDPVPGRGPTLEPEGSAPYADVTEQADGTFRVVWNKDTVPELAHVKPSETRRITFVTRTREDYQRDFDASTPVLSMDSVENRIAVQGVDWVRCSSAPNDCVGAGVGTKIWHQETDGELDFDVSKSGKAASGPQLVKQVAAVFPGNGQCHQLAAAQYGKTLPVYGPGDQVCWKLRIEFPEHLDTRSQDVFDLLPNGLTYVAGSARTTAANTVAVSAPDASVDGRIRWEIGDEDLIDRGGKVFEVTFQSTVGALTGHSSGDVEGNLLKFSFENTAGTAFTLRDRTDFALKVPQLSLVKGVRQVNGTGTPNGPDVDHVRIHEGDVVEYRIDVRNAGAAAVEQGHVQDMLPSGIRCADVVIGSISDGGSCNPLTDRIEWTTVALGAAPAAKMLTYRVTMPADIAPDTTFVNVAGVTRATYVANDGTPHVVVPGNPTIKDPTLSPNAPPAEDRSDVYTPKATVAKTRTTSVTEGGNNAANQATIGETISYVVTTTIPAGTTVHGTPTVTDTLGTRQRYVDGSLTGTFNGQTLAAAGVTATVVDNVVRATLPATVEAGASDAVLVLRFEVTVLDVAANYRGQSIPNKGTLAYRTAANAAKSIDSNTVSTTIVEPQVTTTKAAALAANERVRPDQVVDFTVTARNATGTNVSTAHDAVVVDTLPAGTDPVDANGDAIADGAAVPDHGGVWNATARTITWTTATTPALRTIAPGGSVALKYRVRVENPAVVGRIYTNTVVTDVRSLAVTVDGTRTASSTATTAPDYRAGAEATIKVVLPSIGKSVDPTVGTIGTPLTWTVEVRVPKDLRSFDTTVIDQLPDGVIFDAYGDKTCVSGCLGTDPHIDDLDVTNGAGGTQQAAWFLGDLEPSSSERVYRLVIKGYVSDTYRQAPQAKVLNGASLINRATVKTNRTDQHGPAPTTVPGTFDDSVGPVTATTQVREPKLALTKQADKVGWVEGGDRVTYTVKVENTGNWTAYDVLVEDTPDADLTNVVLGDVQTTGGANQVQNRKAWSAGNPGLAWSIGEIPAGGSVSFTYTADVPHARDLTAGQPIENVADVDEYWGRTKHQRDTNPWTHRRYSGPTDDVVLTVAKPNLTIAKTPDAGQPAAKATAGTDASFTIVVRNTDAHATATDVVVADVLPAGLTYTPGTATAAPSAGFSETDIDADDMLSALHGDGPTLGWRIASLGPNKSVTITLPVHVDSGVRSGTRLTNTATTFADEVPEEKTDTGDLDVEAKTDLRVIKTAATTRAVPGQNVTFTLKTKNLGPSDAHDSALEDVLPDYLTLVSVDGDTGCAADRQTIRCAYGTLKPGDERTLVVVARVDPARTTPVANTATVTTTTPDTNPPNNRSQVTLPVDPTADVSIAKTVDGGVVQGNDTVTYTLRAHNHGPSTATTVKVADAVPSDLTIVSATLVGPPAVDCTITGQQVECPVGTLAPGADATVKLVTKAKGTPPAPKGSEVQHRVKAWVEQEYHQIAAGERLSVDVTCRTGGIATDGSVQVVDMVDQSWSAIDGVVVEQARSIGLGTYRFSVRNATGKPVHLRPLVTCLPEATTGNDHVHPLDVGSLDFQTTGVLAAGARQTLFFPGDRSHRAVAPGIETLTGVARLVASEPATVDGVDGWKLTVEAVADGTTATVGLRRFSAYVTPAGDPLHTHRFGFEHVARQVTLAPGRNDQLRVECPVGSEGIVGSYDLPPGVVSLGNVPMPVNRDFDLYNATGQPQTVTIDLECISLTLESPVTVVEVENTATVSAATFDPVLENNASSVTIGVERAVLPGDPGVDPGPGTPPVPPAPPVPGPDNAPSGGGVTPSGGATQPSGGGSSAAGGTTPAPTLRFGAVNLVATGATASVPVTCTSATRCRGTVTVTAQVPVASVRGVAGGSAVAGQTVAGDAVAGERARKPRTRTVTIGRASYNVARGRTVTVRVRIAARYRTLLRTGQVRNVSLRSGQVTASKRVRVQKPKKSSRSSSSTSAGRRG